MDSFRTLPHYGAFCKGIARASLAVGLGSLPPRVAAFCSHFLQWDPDKRLTSAAIEGTDFVTPQVDASAESAGTSRRTTPAEQAGNSGFRMLDSAEISSFQEQMASQGFCVLESVAPAEAVRDMLHHVESRLQSLAKGAPRVSMHQG